MDTIPTIERGNLFPPALYERTVDSLSFIPELIEAANKLHMDVEITTIYQPNRIGPTESAPTRRFVVRVFAQPDGPEVLEALNARAARMARSAEAQRG